MLLAYMICMAMYWNGARTDMTSLPIIPIHLIISAISPGTYYALFVAADGIFPLIYVDRHIVIYTDKDIAVMLSASAC